MTGVSVDPKGIVKPLVQHYEALKVSPGHFGVRALDDLISLHPVGPQPNPSGFTKTKDCAWGGDEHRKSSDQITPG